MKKKSLSLKLPAGVFSQVNWEVNLKLIEEVLSVIEPRAEMKVYDLYAGAGNFTLPLARSGASVEAVECESVLVRWGRENAKTHGLDQKVTYRERSVEKFLRNEKLDPDSILLADPPRSGLGPLVKELGAGKRLVLISCHLPSFVRDVKQLIQNEWSASRIQAFDMFAQTSYVEMMGVFERTKPL